ncbi:MAG: hypothetical protein KME16_03190 [Scytolyngbya sp. HA4215-MV1]|jgi:hypothetical protein|nr:hypothetical protein [Scytolyngbya sp. HA4215-MV1]
MSFLCLIQCGYIGLRFLRYKASPWLTLAIAPIKLLTSSKAQRTYEQIRYMQAISRINFVSVYELLNDLLW